MTVLICNDVPPAIRGHLKRWFIEPLPNVFIGTLNVRTHRKVMDFIFRNSPKEFGMLALTSAPNCQGYVIERIGPEGKLGRKDVILSGIRFAAWVDEYMGVVAASRESGFIAERCGRDAHAP